MDKYRKLSLMMSLLDDDSVKVRAHVLEDLKNWGLSLREDLQKAHIALSDENLALVLKLEKDQVCENLTQAWPTLFKIAEPHGRLEQFFTYIAQYQNELSLQTELTSGLDKLAREFREQVGTEDPRDLAGFLFSTQGFTGHHEDYYLPANSNLAFVMENKKGIPLTLSCLYMLVGHRVGIRVEGCNLPGHFLSRVRVKGNIYFVDGFNGGQVITVSELLKSGRFNVQKYSSQIYTNVDVNVIILRNLLNIINSYRQKEQNEPKAFFKKLLQMTHESDKQIHVKPQS